jgi:hypothetical protein
LIFDEADAAILSTEISRMKNYIINGQKAFFADAVRLALNTGRVSIPGREALEDLPRKALYNSLAAVQPKRRRAFVLAFYLLPGLPGRGHDTCVRLVRRLSREGAADLPGALRGKEFLTVYHAGRGPEKEEGKRLSWTLSPEVARKYLDGTVHRVSGTEATTLYKGRIRPRDIIAYYAEEGSLEILQYRAVQDISVYCG